MKVLNGWKQHFSSLEHISPYHFEFLAVYSSVVSLITLSLSLHTHRTVPSCPSINELIMNQGTP